MLTPFKARPAAHRHRTRRTPSNAWGAAASAAMYLAEADLAPEQELNEIIWKSVKGADSVMPPPVRAAFIRALAALADDDDDER